MVKNRRSWYVELPSVLAPAKRKFRRGTQEAEAPFQWHPPGNLLDITYRGLADPDKLPEMAIKLAHKLATGKDLKRLKKHRDDQFELAYKELKEELLADEARNAKCKRLAERNQKRRQRVDRLRSKE